MFVRLAIAVGILFPLTMRADSPEKFDAKADVEKLQGIWETDKEVKPRVRLEFKKRGIGLRYLAGGKDATLELLDQKDGFDVKESAGAREIVFSEIVTMIFKLGSSIQYRFEKDMLVVKFAEGDLKGEHRLSRPAKKK